MALPQVVTIIVDFVLALRARRRRSRKVLHVASTAAGSTTPSGAPTRGVEGKNFYDSCSTSARPERPRRGGHSWTAPGRQEINVNRVRRQVREGTALTPAVKRRERAQREEGGVSSSQADTKIETRRRARRLHSISRTHLLPGLRFCWWSARRRSRTRQEIRRGGSGSTPEPALRAREVGATSPRAENPILAGWPPTVQHDQPAPSTSPAKRYDQKASSTGRRKCEDALPALSGTRSHVYGKLGTT